uniref:REX4 homolog, 3'-5' exonuclease n=1 Tax=Canis lupus dingo TaxID=286419 RepID=A0A8C0JI98_CANLU
MAKALTSRRAPGDPQAEPGLGLKLPRKKSRKKRLWKSKRRAASEGAGGGRRVVAGRPPEAPEDFSRNWRALQELLKQKTQAPEKPLVSQTDSKKQPGITQQKRKAILDKAQRSKVEMKTTDPGATGSDSLASGSPGKRKVPAPPTKASRAEHSEKGAKKRTNSDISPRGGDIKCGKWKWKAKEVPVALTPALPTKEDIWFDDVDPADIEAAMGPEAARIARQQLGQSESSTTLVKEQAFGGLTRALAMDCEMVGAGPKGEESVAARVSIVNQYGKCVYDKYVKPTQPVTDYRTAVSGIRPENLKQGEKFEVVQKEVADMLKGRILVGHALHNDLKVLPPAACTPHAVEGLVGHSHSTRCNLASSSPVLGVVLGIFQFFKRRLRPSCSCCRRWKQGAVGYATCPLLKHITWRGARLLPLQLPPNWPGLGLHRGQSAVCGEASPRATPPTATGPSGAPLISPEGVHFWCPRGCDIQPLLLEGLCYGRN